MGSPKPPLVLATSTRSAAGGVAAAAALAVAGAVEGDPLAGTLMIETGAPGRRRGPTLLASESARTLERRLTARLVDPEASGGEPIAARVAARGRLCWLCLEQPPEPEETAAALERILGSAPEVGLAVAYIPASLWGAAAACPALSPSGGLLRADIPRDRSLAALAVTELRERELRARIAARPLGRVAARRALAGLDPGGPASTRAGRWLRGLIPAAAAERGQALPMVLGGAFLLVFVALVLAAIGGAISGRARMQRAADLAAISAVRSMRDDLDRLLAPARRPDGSLNPVHISRTEYLDRAREAAQASAERNGLPAGRLRVSFPDKGSVPAMTARAEVTGEIDPSAATGGSLAPGSARWADLKIEASAEAEAVAPSGFSGAPTMASGGGYSGPLVYRQGKPMRPDVALAFDRLEAAALADGIALIITSAYRSDAEQAALFAANPDPMWVAPPGQSLHRCATELDLGPPSAYSWLYANASRFGFTKRYSWEPWHFGYDGGPPPCSEAGNSLGAAGADAPQGAGGEAGTSATPPAFVPSQFRAPIVSAASRWNVSAGVIAAQLMAESNFDPGAVSPAGAQGIAQFMPGTAASYGLSNPFDPVAAIDAQAHLMSDLLGQFGSLPLALAAYNAGPGAVAACSCVPPYPETQAYVARILSLLDGAGELAVPTLEVRLVA